MAKSKNVDVDGDGKWVFRFKRSAFIRHDRITQDDDGEPGARQEFADECDINVLMRRYEKSGILPTRDGEPIYGDFAELPDYMTAQTIIRDANLAFAALPANVRLSFNNDPAEFVAFASDEANVEQMRLWGLAKPLEAGSGVAPAEPATPPASEVSGGSPTP